MSETLQALRRRLQDRWQPGPAAGPARAPDDADRPSEPPDGAWLGRELARLRATHPRLAAGVERLDPWQQRAVLGRDVETVVRAPVGSGKTTVLAGHLELLHLDRGIPLEQIVVLTFSRRAAAEIGARVAARVGPVQAGRLWAGTFHAIARRLLVERLPVDRLGLPRSFGVLDARAEGLRWQRLIARHGLRVGHRRRLARRVAALAGGQPVPSDDLARLVALSREDDRSRAVISFDGLVEQAGRLLAEVGLQEPFRCVLLDEAQDCDARQLAMIEGLVGPETRLFSVGDPCQSIYGWRGGGVETFAALERRPRARCLGLPRNYRSRPALLRVARALLKRGAERTGGERAGPEPGAPIRLAAVQDARAEAAFVARQLARHGPAGSGWGRLAVLARTRSQLACLFDALERANVPFRAPAIGCEAESWLIGVLRAALGSAPLEEGLAVLGHGRYGALDARRLTKIDPGPTLSSLAGALDAAAGARRRGRAAWRRASLFVRRLADLRGWLDGRTGDVAAELFAHLGLAGWLRPTTAEHDRDVARVRAALARWTAAGADPSALADRLLAQVRSAGLEPVRPDPDAVGLLTMHASKGLEFDHVWIVGANEGWIPLGGDELDAAARAEERRLLYVALTRARETVTLSWQRAPGALRIRPRSTSFLDGLVPTVDAFDLESDGDGAVAPAAVGGWTVGQQVCHARYGEGTLVAVDEARVVATFAAYGARTFSTGLCPLMAVS